MATTTNTGFVPEITTFQMDDGGLGDLSNSVNMFRGDVNLRRTLLSLPGRRENDGLSINIGLIYQSNVVDQASIWNRDAPTSVVGLGWQLGISYIEAQNQGSPVSATRQYTLFEDSIPKTLIRQPIAPRLFDLPASLTTDLNDGSPADTALIEAFGRFGLAISTETTISGSGPWLLEDPVFQQSYEVYQNADSTLSVRDGGEFYQLFNYDFRNIIYYPTYERWVIVSENGVRSSFGGMGDETPQGYKTALGNGIAWEVWWTGESNTPAWFGPSTITTGQTQVARAWYLTSTTDRFGDRITFQYNDWARDLDTGLLPVVERQVGTGGLPFTTAVYLSRAVDVRGRVISLFYDDKLWSNTDTEPREYDDPHAAQPSTAPSPYQDRYETKYLSSLDLTDINGARQISLDLIYNPSPASGSWTNAVANVTSFTGRLLGDTYKRFLTGLVVTDAEGIRYPNLDFAYYLTEESGWAPGTLKSITYPSGSAATYAYSQLTLENTIRSVAVSPPSGVMAGASPSVYFGPDYAVVIWYNADQEDGTLAVEIFTWSGGWIAWSMNSGDPSTAGLLDTRGLDFSTLQVQTQANFVAIAFDRDNNGQTVTATYVIQRQINIPGDWLPATVDGVQVATNTPAFEYTNFQFSDSLFSGDKFLLAYNLDENMQDIYCLRGVFDFQRGSWTTDTVTFNTLIWITAGFEYYVTLDTGGNVTVTSLAPDLTWTTAPSAQIAGFQAENPQDVSLTPGAAMAVIGIFPEWWQGSWWVVTWDADYAVQVSELPAVNDTRRRNVTTDAMTPQIIEDTLVAMNGHLVRFNGTEWLSNTALVPQGVVTNVDLRYDFGPDYALLITAPSDSPATATAQVVDFDPTTLTDAWTTQAMSPSTALSQGGETFRNWPSQGGGDWFSLGPNVYFRGSATDWSNTLAETPQIDLDSLATGGLYFNSASMINAAPGYLGFNLMDGENPQSVAAALLSNGTLAVQTPITLSGQTLVVPLLQNNAPPVVAAGPDMFFSYPTSARTLAQAETITLWAYTNKQVEGPFTHFAVSNLSFDYGYEAPVNTVFSFDTATAAASADGMLAKFYDATSYPNTVSADTPVNGSTAYRYLNGSEQTQDNPYNILDGLLLSKTEFDSAGNLISDNTNTYQVFTTVLQDPGGSSAAPVTLMGGLVVSSAQSGTLDGVTRTLSFGYVQDGMTAPFTSKPVSITTTSNDIGSNLRTFETIMTHAVQIWPEAQAIHALADIATKTTNTFLADASPVLRDASANTYQAWPSRLGPEVTTWSAEARFTLRDAQTSDFPFTEYTPGDIPDGWVVSQRLTSATPLGLPLETLDPIGTPTAIIYGMDESIEVARCINATETGFAYLGFQPYEDLTGWTLSNVTTDTTCARFGQQSARLTSGASVGVQVISPDPAIPYVIGFWYRTEDGYTEGADSGCSATITQSGSPSVTATLPFTNTQNTWVYATLPIVSPTGSAPGDVTVAVTLTNASSSGAGVNLNAVVVAPINGDLTARTVNPGTLAVTSTMDLGGRVAISRYDGLARKTLTILPDGNPRHLTLAFPSRAGTPDSTFDPANPNVQTMLAAASGGDTESFLDQGDWATRWAPGPQTDDWSASAGVLSFVGSGSGTVTWSGADPAGGFAVYLEVSAATNAPDLSLTAGDVTISADDTGFTARQNGTTWSAVTTPPGICRRWVLLVGNGVVCFLVNGQLVFSERATVSGTGITISTTTTGLGLSNLTLMLSPRLSMTYLDGSNTRRQTHHLVGSDTTVAQIIHDGLNNTLATTRSTPGSFGSGSTLGPLQYSPGFVDAAGFLANLDGDGSLSGDVADYYNGQQNGTVQRSQDGGYPYYGARYELRPRGRVIEAGLPGAATAIDMTVAADARATVQTAYAAATAGSGDLFEQVTATSPFKTEAIRATDTRDLLVETMAQDATGGTTAQTASMRAYAVGDLGPSAQLATTYPNANVTGPQSDPSAFIRTRIQDALGRQLSDENPNAGETQYLHDAAGRLRCLQPAMDAGEQWFIYYLYDPLGRQVEEGIVTAPWDPQSYLANLEDPTWPSILGTAIARYQYDGDGTDPTCLGRRVSAVRINPAPLDDTGAVTTTVTETMTYDINGFIRSFDTVIDGPETVSGTLSYGFNSLGEMVFIGLPDQAPLTGLHYGLDDRGRIAMIGSDSGASDIAAYTYTPDGQVETETLGDGAWLRSVSSTSHGLPANVVTQSADGTQSLTMAFDYAVDNVLTARSIAFDFSEFSQTYTATAAYNSDRRLTTVGGSHAVDITSYDPNGNIWAASVDGTDYAFGYMAGTDQLISMGWSENSAALSYTARGQQTSGLGRTLTYDPATALTVEVATGTNTVRFAYGSGGNRVLKHIQSGCGATVYYLNGISSNPIVCQTDGVWSIRIPGPEGLVAIADQTSLQFALKDLVGSSWAVVDSTGLVARFAYLPHGGLVDAPAAGSQPPFPVLYQGQEWDAEIGLYNFKARLYDPVQMRFLAPDPAQQLPSPYGFAANMPLSVIDPSGRISAVLASGLDLGEIFVGFALMVGFPGLGLLGAGLVGAGSFSLADSLASSSNEDGSENTGEFAEDQAIGFAYGILTGFAGRFVQGGIVEAANELRLANINEFNTGIRTLEVGEEYAQAVERYHTAARVFFVNSGLFSAIGIIAGIINYTIRYLSSNQKTTRNLSGAYSTPPNSHPSSPHLGLPTPQPDHAQHAVNRLPRQVQQHYQLGATDMSVLSGYEIDPQVANNRRGRRKRHRGYNQN